jgi:MoaA/NifB/PqqE/SkfB family radical SAM enzyme
MYVTAGGNALPCCIAPFTDAPYQDLVMGNVNNASLLEIWQGDAYRHWRDSLYSDHPPQACAHCGVDWPL